MRISIENNILIINDKRIEFDLEIKKTIQLNDVVVVLLKVPVKQKYNENVFAVSSSGNLLWRIKKIIPSGSDSPYMHAYKVSDTLVGIYNWNGMEYIVDIHTGTVVEENAKK